MNESSFIVPELTPITREQYAILRTLEACGPCKADAFIEEEVDGLFKLRPRLIALVKGFSDAVVEITPAGRLRLHAEERAS
jgi:hypothetical protein